MHTFDRCCAPLSQLDEDGGGSLDIEEIKGLLSELVEKAKQSALDETALEKSATALRRTCLEQQQVIAQLQCVVGSKRPQQGQI